MNLHDFGPQHNVARSLLPVRPGDGLNRHARRVAMKAHDICQVGVHADIRGNDGELPLASDFHAPTLLWALENSQQIALWCEQGTSRQGEVGAWTVNAAHAGSRFQTIINATPEHASDWLAYVTRWKSRDAEVRVYGGETLQ